MRRLIQTVTLLFLLAQGVAAATPVLQAVYGDPSGTAPNTQVICLGQGGMKTITLMDDGSVQEVQTTHALKCPLCLGCITPPPTSHICKSVQAPPSEEPHGTYGVAIHTAQLRLALTTGPPLTF